MAIALITNVAAGSAAGGDITTGSVNTTGANFLIATLSWDNATSDVVTDSKGNTWTKLTEQPSGIVKNAIFYVLNPTVGSGHTFTGGSGGTSFPTVCAAAFSGVKVVTAFDVQNGNWSTSGTVLQPGSVSPSENNELIVTGLGLITTATASIDIGFTIANQVDYAAGAHYFGALGYLIQTTAAAVNPSWSWGLTNHNAATIATFKAATIVPSPSWRNFPKFLLRPAA